MQFDLYLLINHDGFGSELDAHCHVILVGELSLDVLGEHGCLSHTLIDNWLPWCPKMITLNTILSIPIYYNNTAHPNAPIILIITWSIQLESLSLSLDQGEHLQQVAYVPVDQLQLERICAEFTGVFDDFYLGVDVLNQLEVIVLLQRYSKRHKEWTTQDTNAYTT